MPAAIEITDGAEAIGHRLELAAGGAVLGRSTDADLTVAVAQLSRRHARFEHRNDQWWLTDLGSTNGTWVNGEPIGERPVALGDGDQIVLGGVVSVRFADDDATRRGPRIGRLVGLWLDPDTDAVWIDAVRLEPPLSARQLDLLRLLIDRSNEIVDRPTIVAEVWADVAADGVSDDAVTALI